MIFACSTRVGVFERACRGLLPYGSALRRCVGKASRSMSITSHSPRGSLPDSQQVLPQRGPLEALTTCVLYVSCQAVTADELVANPTGEGDPEPWSCGVAHCTCSGRGVRALRGSSTLLHLASGSKVEAGRHESRCFKLPYDRSLQFAWRMGLARSSTHTMVGKVVSASPSHTTSMRAMASKQCSKDGQGVSRVMQPGCS